MLFRYWVSTCASPIVSRTESTNDNGMDPLRPMPDQSTVQYDLARTTYRPCRLYVYPQSGLSCMPNLSSYAVPGVRHTVTSPSPIDHTTRDTFAVAVTVNPPADADLVTGPHVDGPGLVSHIHTGIPTKPTDPGRASGTVPIETDFRFILAIARCAKIRGSGGAPAGGCANQIWKTGTTKPEARPARVHS